MKYSSITTLLLALVASSATAEFLRNSNSPLSMDSFTSETIRRRLNANTDLINKVIKAILPTLNTGLQAAIPDPFTVDQTASFSPGTVNSGSCSGQNAQVTVSYTLQQLTGQNTTQISSLTVREGTESVRCGCGHQDFSGTFDIVLEANKYEMDGYANITTNPNCKSVNTEMTSTIYKPVFHGVLTMSGTIKCNHATINSVNVTSMNATCDNVTTTFTNLPPEFDSVKSTIEEKLQTFIKTYVQTKFIAVLQLAIDAGLAAAKNAWSFLTFMGFNLAFIRVNGYSNLKGLVNNFLGFIG